MTRAMAITGWVGDGTGGNPNRPAVADAYPIVAWRDRTAQPAEWIPKGALPYTVEIEATDAVLDQIEIDPVYALLWRGRPPETLDVATVKAQLVTVLDVDVAEWCVRDAASWGDVQAKLSEAQHRPPWRTGEAVAVDDVRAYRANLYRCVQAHTTQADWAPPATPALWVKFFEASAGPQPWAQPAGAHDAYPLGAQVTHNGSTWESTVDANVWEPGVFGWTRL